MQIAFLRDVCDFRVKKLYAKCNRGGAKTWLTGVGTACLIDNTSKLKVSVLSGSFDQASICYDYMSDFFTQTSMSDKLVGEVTMKKTRWRDGGIVRVLTASTKKTKAPRVDVIIIDEACETKANLIDTVLPQVITATNLKIIILTTPDDLNHKVHDWWVRGEELGFVRYSWDAYQCPWIPRANIEEYRNLFDETNFRIMILAEWTSKTGSPFKYADVMASLCDISDLPPVNKIDRFALGIDWGDAHPTVATILGMRGDVNLGTDQWFVYDQLEFTGQKLDILLYGGIDTKGQETRGILDLIDLYQPYVLSEQAPISAHANRELRTECAKRGIILVTESFTHRKHRMVGNLKGSFEKAKIKIPRIFKKLIEQLIAYHFKKTGDRLTEEFEKVNDDHVDSLNWARWLIHPAQASISTLGEFKDYL